MKAYKNYIITIAVLLVIYLLIAIPPLFVKKDMPQKMFPKLDKNSISKFIIEPPGGRKNLSPVTLINESGKWYVSINHHNYDVDSEKIEKIVNSVVNLTSVRVVTKNMKELSQYNLDDKNVYKLGVYLNNKLFTTIYIGKTARDFRSTFFKLEDENIVRVSPESLISYVSGQPKSWMDHTIFKIDMSTIDAIDLPKVKLYKKNNDWHFKDTDRIKVDTEKVSAFLNIFTNFRTNDFELNKTKKQCGLDKPEPIIKLSSPHNIYEIFRGNSDKHFTYIFVKINHKELPMIYKFYTSRIKGLLKEPESFVLEQKGNNLLKKK